MPLCLYIDLLIKIKTRICESTKHTVKPLIAKHLCAELSSRPNCRKTNDHDQNPPRKLQNGFDLGQDRFPTPENAFDLGRNQFPTSGKDFDLRQNRFPASENDFVRDHDLFPIPGNGIDLGRNQFSTSGEGFDRDHDQFPDSQEGFVRDQRPPRNSGKPQARQQDIKPRRLLTNAPRLRAPTLQIQDQYKRQAFISEEGEKAYLCFINKHILM